MKYIFCFTLFFFFSFACTTKKDHPSSPDLLTVDLDKKNVVKFSEMVEEIEYFLLKGEDEALLAEPYKFLFSDSLIFIEERFTQRILVFDRSGSFLNTIGKPGSGPFENMSIDDFSIFQDTLWMKDAKLGKILGFDYQGNPLVEDKMPLMRSLFVKGAGFFLIYANNNTDYDFRILRMASNNKITGYLKIEDWLADKLMKPVNTFLFNKEEEKYYFMMPYSNEIVSFDKRGESIQRIKLDFGKYNFKPMDWERLESFPEQITFATENNLVFQIGNFFMTKEILWIQARQEGGKNSYILLNHKFELVNQFDEFLNDIDHFDFATTPWTASENEIYFKMRSGDFIRQFREPDSHRTSEKSNLVDFVNQNGTDLEDPDHIVLIRLVLK